MCQTALDYPERFTLRSICLVVTVSSAVQSSAPHFIENQAHRLRISSYSSPEQHLDPREFATFMPRGHREAKKKKETSTTTLITKSIDQSINFVPPLLSSSFSIAFFYTLILPSIHTVHRAPIYTHSRIPLGALYLELSICVRAAGKRELRALQNIYTPSAMRAVNGIDYLALSLS